MLQFRRPRKPSGFEELMTPYQQRVEASLEAGERPEFEPVWRSYKLHFGRAQYGKCGYCEAPALATGVGEVEHFRPKGELSELDDDPGSWGRERSGLANVKGRKPRRVFKRGYWWLAYSWGNWLLACNRCNSGWKGSLFPVAESPRPAPAADVVETPLLLDPFGSEDPGDHLRFNALGQVEAVAGSPMGFETIRTLGLDRHRLRDSREEKAKRIHSLVREVEIAHGERLLTILSDILEMGRREYPHAGMVRAVFKQETGLDWSVLDELLSREVEPQT